MRKFSKIACSARSHIHRLYTVGHEDEIIIFWSYIETFCFFFGSFITLEQVNDYVMILEYQGGTNIIMQNVQWTRVFSAVTLVTKTT